MKYCCSLVDSRRHRVAETPGARIKLGRLSLQVVMKLVKYTDSRSDKGRPAAFTRLFADELLALLPHTNRHQQLLHRAERLVSYSFTVTGTDADNSQLQNRKAFILNNKPKVSSKGNDDPTKKKRDED